jgi:hypothetical protein
MDVSDSFTPLPLYIVGNSPRHPLYRRLDKPQTGLDVMEKRQIPCPLESNPSSSVVQPVD